MTDRNPRCICGHLASRHNELSRCIVARGFYECCCQNFTEREAQGEVERLGAMVDVLLPVAQLYVDAFGEHELMTLPERLRLQQVEDILADRDHWSPETPHRIAGDR